MIRLEDPKFKVILWELEKATSQERLAFFSELSADKFLIWWFFYYSDDFITPLADFHYDWIEALLSDKNVIIEWFRWSIKTTITSAVTTYKIANKFCKYVVWQSYEDWASTSNTTQIAFKLLNQNLINDYGRIFKLTWWSKEDLEKKSVWNFDTSTWIKVRATSLWQKLRWAISKNQRPDLLILDDIDVSDSVRNPDIINKNYEKITWETFGAMTKDWKSQIYFLWNTINQDWIVPRFTKEKKWIKGWTVFHQPLIVDWEIVWDFFTEELIEKIKEDEWPVAFNQNYMLIPIDLYVNWLIKLEDLRYYDYVNIGDFDDLYMHCDVTHTWKQTSDFFAPMIIWENKRDKNYYVLDFALEKLDVEQQARFVINMYIRYSNKIKKLTYDEKSNNGFWYWIKKLAKEEYNISLPIQELWYPNDKVSHFTPHIPHFKANRIYLPANHKDLKEAELQILAFPTKWVHDDVIDAFSWCLDNYVKIKSSTPIRNNTVIQRKYFDPIKQKWITPSND